MEFRSATVADVDAIVSLWAATGVGADEDTDRHEIVERLKEDDGFFVIAEWNGELVGSAMACYDNHRGWMKRVVIEPSRQGRGLGRELVAEVERRFLAAGITKLRLAVWDSNDDGIAFWNQLDYVELSDIHYFSKDLLAPGDG